MLNCEVQYSCSRILDILQRQQKNLETCYCLGADNIRHVDRIRGSSIKYCYCDEAATYNQAVFEMLKSRLDKDYSRCDATSNPDAPAHWYKKFIDSDIDAFRQTYTIDDNPTLPPSFVDGIL